MQRLELPPFQKRNIETCKCDTWIHEVLIFGTSFDRRKEL
jgi:hypothetical protein